MFTTKQGFCNSLRFKDWLSELICIICDLGSENHIIDLLMLLSILDWFRYSQNKNFKLPFWQHMWPLPLDLDPVEVKYSSIFLLLDCFIGAWRIFKSSIKAYMRQNYLSMLTRRSGRIATDCSKIKISLSARSSDQDLLGACLDSFTLKFCFDVRILNAPFNLKANY